MSKKRPFWLPEDATRASQDDSGEPNFVAYVAPNGRVRKYLANDQEMSFYETLFNGLEDSD